MTTSNLDLARECGAKVALAGIPTGIEGDVIPMLILFDGAQLDAFADNIRANHLPDDGGMISEAALSHAINQASCSIDDAIETGLIRAVSKAIWRQLQAQQSAQAQPVALPAGMPEPVASVYTMDALVPGGGVRHHVTLHKPLPAGTKLYTAAQVQAMLAAAPQPVTQPSPAAVERKPLTLGQIGDAVRAAHIAFCLDKFPTFEHAIVHFTEQAHGIAAQQGDKT